MCGHWKIEKPQLIQMNKLMNRNKSSRVLENEAIYVTFEVSRVLVRTRTTSSCWATSFTCFGRLTNPTKIKFKINKFLPKCEYIGERESEYRTIFRPMVESFALVAPLILFFCNTSAWEILSRAFPFPLWETEENNKQKSFNFEFLLFFF